MDRLRAIESFVAAVDEGTISGAAKRMGAVKSVVSRRIMDLEAHLGVRLLNRNARRLSLTDAGSTYCEHARRILRDLANAETITRDDGAALRGTLRIAAPMSFGTLHLKSIVIALMAKWPELVIDLDLNDWNIDLPTEGHDLAVRIGVLRDSSLIVRRIANNQHQICASPAYLNVHGTPTSPEQLAGHHGLLYSPREPRGVMHIEHGEALLAYPIEVRMRCNNGEVLQAAALAGRGLAILPTFMAAPHIASGALRVVLGDYALPDGDISVVYVRDLNLSPKVRMFIDALLEAYNPVPPWDRIAETRDQGMPGAAA